MNKRLFIIAQARSGSSWLYDTLNSNPEIMLLGELLSPAWPKSFLKRIILAIFLRIPQLRPAYSRYTGKGLADVSTLEKFLSPLPAKWAGCKILHEHLFWNITDNRDFFKRYSDAHVIFLRRENKIASAISLLQARHSWIWNTCDPATKAIPMHISLHRLIQTMEKTSRMNDCSRRKIMESGMHCLEITYEDMFTDPQKILSSIARFLNISDTFSLSKLQKQAQTHPRTYVTNWADIERALAGNKELSSMIAKLDAQTAKV